MANHNYMKMAIALDCNHFPPFIYSYIGKTKKQGVKGAKYQNLLTQRQAAGDGGRGNFHGTHRCIP